MEEVQRAMTCPLCGQPATGDALFCSQCGHSLTQAMPAHGTARGRWYYNVWFMLFMLFCVVGPFGLPLVWKNPRLPRLVKVILTGVMAGYTILMIGLVMQMVHAVAGGVDQFNATLQF